MAQIQFKGKSFVQNHHLLVKYHELIPKNKKMALDSSGKVLGEETIPNFDFIHVLHERPSLL